MNDILTVRDLSVHFRQGKRLVQLVDRVSFSVARGECLGILGESGSVMRGVITRLRAA